MVVAVATGSERLVDWCSRDNSTGRICNDDESFCDDGGCLRHRNRKGTAGTIDFAEFDQV